MRRCKYCGKEFEHHRPTHVFCSNKCYKKSLNHSSNSVIGKITMKKGVCWNCGMPFTLSFPNEKFCSDNCRLQYFMPNDLMLH